MTMPNSVLLAASCRMALAAYLHDLGKFAERARIEVPKDALDAHKTQYCPFRTTDAGGKNGFHTHVHAAYTGLAFDIVERTAPDLIQGDMHPFINREQLQSDPARTTDSLINAAAAHHRPETFLQWVIATADRVASGFERDEFDKYNDAKDENEETKTGRNHYQARQLSLFEQINKQKNVTAKDLLWRYPLKALSPKAIFPQLREQCEPGNNEEAQAQYKGLWDDFLKALRDIPKSHSGNWPLWLDHFDTAWLTFTQAIPSATAGLTKPEVSLYDHSKTTAALATALWRWHEAERQTDAAAAVGLKDRSDWDTQKFLLIQGDFFGIQDFVFAEGSQTNKAAAKLLRGRSFQVSLFTELAALKVLEALALPPTSQITNAAGKFLIVAPNTQAAKDALKTVTQEINQWFLTHSFGLAGLGLVGKPASCNDFLKGNFKALIGSLFSDLEKAKLQRFDLTADVNLTPTVFAVNYPYGVCQYNGRLPADKAEGSNKASAALSRDQIKLGSQLVRKDRILVTQGGAALHGAGVTSLETAIFGYNVAFTDVEEETGKFGPLARDGSLLRCWDFSLPDNLEDTLWNGYARRFINAYVPRFTEDDQWAVDRYTGCDDDVEFERAHFAGKTLNHIACEDRQPRRDQGGWKGQVALMTLKGDVDNLGTIFQQGLQEPTFAKMAALSRQMNAFFAIWLPAVCKVDFPNTYTVFAGGDDFFLIGPWHRTQELAARMEAEFKTYVAHNPGITFSAGMVMTKPGLPMHTLATQAEEALDEAKGNNLPDTQERKNALVLYGERVRWPDWGKVQAAQDQLDDVRDAYDLSTGYVYGLLQLITLAADTKNPEHAMWRSRFAYRTRRYVVDKLEPEKRQRAQTELSVALGQQGIEELGTRYRIPLFNHFYRQR